LFLCCYFVLVFFALVALVLVFSALTKRLPGKTPRNDLFCIERYVEP